MLRLLSVRCRGVHGRSLHLGCWLLMWLSGSSSLRHSWMRLYGCLWLGGCLGCFREVTSGPLRTFNWKLLPRPLFWWHFMGVLSKCPSVDANVGVRHQESIEFQPKREITLNEKRKMTRRMMQTRPRGARVGLFIREVKSLITFP
jgi:hypothetical protein